MKEHSSCRCGRKALKNQKQGPTGSISFSSLFPFITRLTGLYPMFLFTLARLIPETHRFNASVSAMTEVKGEFGNEVIDMLDALSECMRKISEVTVADATATPLRFQRVFFSDGWSMGWGAPVAGCCGCTCCTHRLVARPGRIRRNPPLLVQDPCGRTDSNPHS